jgi:hypothetical protein
VSAPRCMQAGLVEKKAELHYSTGYWFTILIVSRGLINKWCIMAASRHMYTPRRGWEELQISLSKDAIFAVVSIFNWQLDILTSGKKSERGGGGGGRKRERKRERELKVEMLLQESVQSRRRRLRGRLRHRGGRPTAASATRTRCQTQRADAGPMAWGCPKHCHCVA